MYLWLSEDDPERCILSVYSVKGSANTLHA